MADIPKIEIEVPEGVTVTINGYNVSVTGPKGKIDREFRVNGLDVKQVDKKVVVTPKTQRRKNKAIAGTVAGHIKNMVIGVTKGYEYQMVTYYKHFPVTLSIDKNKVIIKNFLGEKHPRESVIVGETKVEVKGQDIFIKGPNKEHVGQTSANLVLASKVPNRDPRVFGDGIFVVKKGVMQNE